MSRKKDFNRALLSIDNDAKPSFYLEFRTV